MDIIYGISQPVSVDKYIFKQIINPDSGYGFGRTSAISNSGNVIVVGKSHDNASPIPAGAAYIYTGNVNNGWDFKQKINNIQNISQICISDDNSIIAIGNYGYNDGKVEIYTGSVDNGWQLKQSLYYHGASFGGNVAMSDNGNVIVSSAPMFNLPGYNGLLAVYTGNKNDGWAIKQYIFGTNSIPTASRLGESISVNNDASTIVAGATFQNYTGAVNVYTGNASNGWSLNQTIFGNSWSSYFGHNSILNKNNNVLAILDNHSGYIYAKEQNLWNFKQAISGTYTSVALANDGNIIIFGNSNPAGSVDIFYKKNNNWNLKEQISGAAYYRLGNYINIDKNNTMLASAYEYNNTGAVLVYEKGISQFYQDQDVIFSSAFDDKINFNPAS